MTQAQLPFITVQNGQLMEGNKNYHFVGTNFWYGMNLGSTGEGGDRARLIKELDQLSALGFTNLRIMGASEGPDDQPWRILPSLQTGPGEYKEELWKGLDFLLAEMGKRNMRAVVCLNNFWPWSGGMAQYRKWAGAKDIPYPPPAEGGDWTSYQLYTMKFYKDSMAVSFFEAHLRKILTRTNSITGIAYKDDPTIMTWQLANEPRGLLNRSAFVKWIEQTARLIKELDPQHLVSLGSEGNTPSKFAGTHIQKDHLSEYIDYATCHIWIQNWGWYDPMRHTETFEKAKKKAKKYLAKHIRGAKTIGKPLVLEEFGIARDKNNHDPQASVIARNAYYDFMLKLIHQKAENSAGISGANFWAWGGMGRPCEAHAIWKKGDDFIGDPPHEHQGWYSVYDTDESTLAVLSKYADLMQNLH